MTEGALDFPEIRDLGRELDLSLKHYNAVLESISKRVCGQYSRDRNTNWEEYDLKNLLDCERKRPELNPIMSPEALDNILDFVILGLPIVRKQRIKEMHEDRAYNVKVMAASKGFDVTMVLPDVLHFNFRRVEDMCSYLLRFQEHAESPKFYNQVFSWSRLKAFYGRRTKKSFAGFNIPSWAILGEASRRGEGFRLTDKEEAIADLLDSLTLGLVHPEFYVIASADSQAQQPSQEALKHELAQALYYINSNYKKAVDTILFKYDVSAIRKKLSKWGIYHSNVWDDETHAYLATDTQSVLEGRFQIKLQGDLLAAHGELKALLDATLEKESQ
jgi:hypothetical protein